MSDFSLAGSALSLAESDVVKRQVAQEEELLREVESVEIPLSAEQEAEVVELAKGIDLLNNDQILGYGAQDAKAISEMSDRLLSKVRSSELASFGSALTDLTAALVIDDQVQSKGVLGRLFKRAKNRIQELQLQYESAAKTLDRIGDTLDNNLLKLKRTDLDLRDMEKDIVFRYQRVNVHLEAGRLALAEAEPRLRDLQAKAQASGSAEDLNAYTALHEGYTLMSKQVADLDASQMMLQNSAVQNRSLLQANAAMVQKTARCKNVLIPAWRQVMASLFMAEQTASVVRDDQILTEATNAMLVRASGQMREVTVAAAEQSEKEIIQVETLKKMTDEVIETLRSIDQVQQDAQRRRQDAAVQLEELRGRVAEAISGRAIPVA